MRTTKYITQISKKLIRIYIYRKRKRKNSFELELYYAAYTARKQASYIAKQSEDYYILHC